MSTVVKMEHLKKCYGDLVIIPDLSLTVKDGEFFTLLGPSGCGKTTLLRMIAGFNTVEGGSISFNDRDITAIPAHKRGIGMVFQNYAIFPHMTVWENAAYGLKMQKVSKAEIKVRVEEVLRSVQMLDYADRMPANLSGGQQQRVALARAIVVKPDLLLMDEPLSNLDAKLRVEMRNVIRELQQSVGITTIYVTHDQEEALAVSDRIAIMEKGHVMQVGTPETVYKEPQNLFAATFIGQSDLFDGRLHDKKVTLDEGYSFHTAIAGEQDVKVCIRPEAFRLSKEHGIKGQIQKRTYLGRFTNYTVKLADERSVEVSLNSLEDIQRFQTGDSVFLDPRPESIRLFDRITGEVIS